MLTLGAKARLNRLNTARLVKRLRKYLALDAKPKVKVKRPMSNLQDGVHTFFFFTAYWDRKEQFPSANAEQCSRYCRPFIFVKIPLKLHEYKFCLLHDERSKASC